MDMDFPEKAIIGVLGDVTTIEVPASVSVRELGQLDRIGKQRVMVELSQERRAGHSDCRMGTLACRSRKTGNAD